MKYLVIPLILLIAIYYFYNNIEHFGFFENWSPNIANYYVDDRTQIPITILSDKRQHKLSGGIFGKLPIIQQCTRCKLHDNCINSSYAVSPSPTKMNVCTECNAYANTLMVGARSVGRPRVCREII